jgi:hypothetical protein
LIAFRRFRPNHRVLDSLTEKDAQEALQKCGTGVYLQEGTISRVMAADRPYGDVYDFYSVIPEYFGYILVLLIRLLFPKRRYVLGDADDAKSDTRKINSLQANTAGLGGSAV